jgi:hypothetical protein
VKKALIVILIITLLSGLLGCDPSPNHLQKDDLLAATIKIELVDYNNENPKLLSINGIKKPKFDFSKVTSIATLEESRFEELINYISEIDYLYDGTALNAPMGKTLILHQSNGNIIVLFGCTYTDEDDETRYFGECYVFDEYGALVEYIGSVGYTFSDHIVSTYFQSNS